MDVADERLWKDAKELRLRRKPFAILKLFVKNPRRLITHDEIVEGVWGKVVMSESLVRTHVRDLRQALGDDIIETVVGRGYRFLADVSEGGDAGVPAPSAPGDSTARTASIVGRDSELDALDAALRSARERSRAVVFLTGEPGVGKTTLVDSFLDRARARSTVWVARGTCIEQYGSGEAYLPVLEAIGGLCRSRGGERVVEVLFRHAPTWLAQMPGLVAEGRSDELARRAAGAGSARMLREIAEALEALSNEAPVILALDDLQWSDPSTLDLVGMLARRRDPARLLVLASYRPSDLAASSPLLRVAGELVAHRHASEVHVEPFDEARVGAFLAHQFPGHGFPPELVPTLHRTTGGNPLFVATLVEDLKSRGMIRETNQRWALETDVARVAAQRPDGVRRLIDMQIDRLGATEQRILEAAGVAGITFTAGAIARALDAEEDDVDSTCETLAANHRFLQYAGTETWPDGTIHTRYAFEHALVQHAALARTASASVRLWHRKIAERLEAGYAGHEEEIASELAVHFEQGQKPVQAARYFIVAGQRVARRFGQVEAAALFERALALVPSMPEGRARDLLELQASFDLGQRLFQLRGAGSIPALERARDLARQLGDPRLLAMVLGRLQLGRIARGDFRDAAEHGAALSAAADATGDPAQRRFATQTEALVALHRGKLIEARRLFESMGTYDANLDTKGADSLQVVAAVSNAALVSLFTGRASEALTLQRRAFEIAEASGDPFEQAATLCDWSRLHAWRRDPAQAEALAERSLALSEEGSFDLWKNRATAVLVWARAQRGDASTSALLDSQCAQSWESGEAGMTLYAALVIDACRRLSLVDRALEIAQATIAVAERRDERIALPEIHRARGEILKDRDKAEAEAAFLSAIEIAREQGSTLLELRAGVSMCGVAAGPKKKRARADVARVLTAFGDDGLDLPDTRDARAIADS